MINLEDKHVILFVVGLLLLTACGGGQKQSTDTTAQPANPTTQNPPTPPNTNTNTTVVPAGKILVTLSWAPGNNGTGITRGYYVYHGTRSGALTQRIDVGNVTSIQLAGTDFGYTTPGNYYFSVNSYDQNSTQSLPGSEVMVNIQP